MDNMLPPNLSNSGNFTVATPRPTSVTVNIGRDRDIGTSGSSNISSNLKGIISNIADNGVTAKTSLFKNILLLQDVDFFCSVLDNFCRSSSTQKITDLINALIVIMDDSFLELLRLFIKQTIDIAKQSSSTDESNPLNYQSFYNIINRMAAIYLKSQLGGLMEKTMIAQISNFTPMIQEHIQQQQQAQQLNSANNTPSTPGSSSISPIINQRSGLVIGSSFNNHSNSSGNESLDGNSSNGSSPTSGRNASPNVHGSVHMNNNGQPIYTPISSPTIGSTTPTITPPQQSTTFLNSTTTNIPNINIDDIKNQISQFSISIINTIFRAIEKFPSGVFQLFELLYLDTHQIFSPEFCFELIKKIFFTKLVCPILANLKSPTGMANGAFFGKVYIEVSKVVLDIAFDRDTPRRGVTTQEQVLHFIKSMIFRTHSSIVASLNNPVIPHSVPLPSKEEACNTFIAYIRSESNELEESFRRAKDLNTCVSLQRADRHIVLFNIFKDMLINFKISFSLIALSNSGSGINNSSGGNNNNNNININNNLSSSPNIGSRSNQFQTIRNGRAGNGSANGTPVMTSANGGQISNNPLVNPWVSNTTTNNSEGGMQHTRVIPSLSKKWTSDELKNTYNGKSPKKRSWVLDKKNIKNQIINVHIILDQFPICRILTVPMNITFQALANRIHTDPEFSEFKDQLNTREEYEMVVRYPDEITVLNDENSQEVVCEPELPLWMFDIDSDTIIIFRPIKRRSPSTSFNIFLKFIFPQTNSLKINPIIIYINPLSTPQSIIDEKLSKLLPQLDTAHLGFYLRDIDDESSSPSSLKIPNNNPFAHNKISTMDIIECSPRLSYEFSISVNGMTQQILMDFDNGIDFVANSFYNLYHQLLDISPRSIETSSTSSTTSSDNGNVNGGNGGSGGSNNSSKHNSGNYNNPSNATTEYLRRSGTFEQLNNYSLALVSNTNFLPMFLPGNSKLHDYCLSVGDELLLTEKTFVSLVDNLVSQRKPVPLSSSLSQSTLGNGVYNSSPYLSNYIGVSSLSLIADAQSSNKVIARVKITWAGSNSSFDRQTSFINTSLNVNTNSISTMMLNEVLSNPNQIQISQRPLLSTTIAQDNTFACVSKNDYCMNNQVKLCIVGDESAEKLQFYNSLRKNYSPNGLLSSSSRGIPAFFSGPTNSIPEVTIDSCLHTSELVVGQDFDQITFKTFYLSGADQYQVVHPMFLSPQSLFIITYNPLNINSVMIDYWLEIIQTKAQGSSIYLVGLSNASVDEKKFTNFRSDYHKLFRFNNIVSWTNISLKNSKQIKLLAGRLQTNAKMKQFQYKIPLSWAILKSQCAESAKEAAVKNKMPLSSIPFIKNIARIFSIEPRDSEAAVKYLYEIGEILYYKYEANDELLNELVFLDTMWMSKLISAVLSLKTQNGMTVVEQVSIAFGSQFPQSKTRSLLTLLEKFELIYLSSEDSSVIIPQLFGGERPSVMRDLWSPTAHANNEYKRVYEFQFLPKGFFSRLSVRILQHYDPLCIWQHGMVLQPAGQLWGGAAKSFDSQCLIEYDSVAFKLKISIRDDNKSQLLRSIVDLVSSFILWYFPGRLGNVQVACTHCTTAHIENPTLYTLDYLENQASQGLTDVICKAQLGGKMHETLSPRTTKIDIYSLAFEVTFNSNKFSVIPYETLKFGPQLGSGSYATVYRGIWNQSEVAIKVLNFDDGHNTTEKFREFRNEAHITGELRHANTVSLKGVSLNPFCLITELLQYGDLAKYIRNTSETFSWGTVLKLSLDIAKGMNFLHSCKPMIVHRDLKSANILLGGSSLDTLVAKVSDFGLSIKPIGNEVKGRKVWNWRWLAPEIIADQQYTEKIDVYSYAIVLWEIITRDLPFEEYVDQLKWNSIIEDKIIKGLRPTIPNECPPEMMSLITDCWNGDPKKRPSFNLIVERLYQMQKTFKLTDRLEFCKQLPPIIEEPLSNQLPPPPQQQPPNTPAMASSLSISHFLNNGGSSVGSNSSSVGNLGNFVNNNNHGNGGVGMSTSISSNSSSFSPIINNHGNGTTTANTSQSQTNSGTNSGSSAGIYGSDGSLSSAGNFKILKFQATLPIVFTSTIHSLFPMVNNRNESFVWCGMGDGSVCVVNSSTRQIVSTSRCADSSRILGFSLIKKQTVLTTPGRSVSTLFSGISNNIPSSLNPMIDDDSQIWAFYNEGVLCFEAKSFKLLKTIKTNFITSLVDEGESVWTNCKEKQSCIKVISKSKLKTKKLVNVKTMDAQITTIFINHSSTGALSSSRVWLGTDRGMVFISEYPSLAPIAHHESHGGGLIHTIKKLDRMVITCSERVICVFDESGIIKKRIDGLTSRVLSVMVLDSFIIGVTYDSTILVWDSKQNFRLVQSIRKKHNDAISSIALSISPTNKPQLWVGGWDKKITTYSFLEELENTLSLAMLPVQQQMSHLQLNNQSSLSTSQQQLQQPIPIPSPRPIVSSISKSKLFG